MAAPLSRRTRDVPDKELVAAELGNSASGWVADDDGTFVGAMGKIYLRRVDGRVEVALQTEERHRNLSGYVHGGVIMTLMDRAMGINCREAAGGRAVTMTITVNFVDPVRTGDFVRTTCKLAKVGRSVIFAEGEAYVGDHIVATASCICRKIVKPAGS